MRPWWYDAGYVEKRFHLYIHAKYYKFFVLKQRIFNYKVLKENPKILSLSKKKTTKTNKKYNQNKFTKYFKMYVHK